MQLPQPHDIAAGGLAGGFLAAVGAAIRALQTPISARAVVVCALVGWLFGGLGTMCLLWQYPDVPFPISCGCGAFIGYVSKHVSDVAVKISDVLLNRVEKHFDDANGTNQK